MAGLGAQATERRNQKPKVTPMLITGKYLEALHVVLQLLPLSGDVMNSWLPHGWYRWQ